MLDVSEVVNAPELQEQLTITRNTGEWQTGVWVPTNTTLYSNGVVSVASAHELEMLPEADVGHGAMVFWSQLPLYVTRNPTDSPTAGQTSDILSWGGHNYRLLEVKPYFEWGYYRAIGVRMEPI